MERTCLSPLTYSHSLYRIKDYHRSRRLSIAVLHSKVSLPFAYNTWLWSTLNNAHVLCIYGSCTTTYVAVRKIEIRPIIWHYTTDRHTDTNVCYQRLCYFKSRFGPKWWSITVRPRQKMASSSDRNISPIGNFIRLSKNMIGLDRNRVSSNLRGCEAQFAFQQKR